ncbi:MAG: hypothetical protein HYU66_24825 [Armatimonadetes bacterium]|nr:hypothetical protein [Armatimonadota bacterium]
MVRMAGCTLLLAAACAGAAPVGAPLTPAEARSALGWLAPGIDLAVTNEATHQPGPAPSSARTRIPGGLQWDLTFAADTPRAGHEVTLEFPLLTAERSLFTPTERGVMAVAGYPTYRPAPYASVGWGDGRCYVLPLVSVLDPATDQGLTIALPPDPPIPHLQVEWRDAKTLRFVLAHRAMGGGRPATLRLLFWSHPADYRSAVAAYSAAFPDWFEPPLPRGEQEGVFYYHHIQDHPDYDEMARQHVRYLWSSFWFTWLGEYLPAENEWAPYTYARWWKLGQTMTDDRISSFARDMTQHGIGTYAYFNVTEYGGAGGKGGDAAAAERLLREQFANALVHDQAGRPIPTWEGAMAMNPGHGYALFPVLQEQVRRHLERLPGLAGFIIDRLDWASVTDWGHDDGQTMVGDRAVEDLAGPVEEAVREVCRLSHAAGKRVFVNQFYRVEPLRDTDGCCHENDYVRGLGYLLPYKPISAWHMRYRYDADLLAFEAQLKRRLQWAVFPQMIAHQFPISQQGANPRAADLLEIYAPLFESLRGKRQVLVPHCVEVTGANDANLFVDGQGRYVVPVTSRVRFLSRRTPVTEDVTVTLRMATGGLTWAQVHCADGPPYTAELIGGKGVTRVLLPRHGTASVLVVGQGRSPQLPEGDAGRLGELRERLFPAPAQATVPPAARPELAGVTSLALRLGVTRIGEPGPLEVALDGRPLGRIEGPAVFRIEATALPAEPPKVCLSVFDEGTWPVPERVELLAVTADGKRLKVARWTPEMPSGGGPGRVELPLAWCFPEEVPPVTAQAAGRDVTSGGRWEGRYGKLAAWLPAVDAATAEQNGYRLELRDGTEFTWRTSAGDDPRVPLAPGGQGDPRASCWFANDTVRLAVTPPGAASYRLTVYLLDFDRNKRGMQVALLDDLGLELSTADAAMEEMDTGVYLGWTVTGPVTIEVRKRAGFNAVVSGVFVDRG